MIDVDTCLLMRVRLSLFAWIKAVLSGTTPPPGGILLKNADPVHFSSSVGKVKGLTVAPRRDSQIRPFQI